MERTIKGRTRISMLREKRANGMTHVIEYSRIDIGSRVRPLGAWLSQHSAKIQVQKHCAIMFEIN